MQEDPFYSPIVTFFGFLIFGTFLVDMMFQFPASYYVSLLLHQNPKAMPISIIMVLEMTVMIMIRGGTLDPPTVHYHTGRY